MTQKTFYYLPEYTDEGGEFCGDLAKIANDLNDVNFGMDPLDGETYRAVRQDYVYVPCHCTAAGYEIPAMLPGPLLALAIANGAGWTPEMLCNTREEAAELLRECGDQDVEYLVCSVARIDGTIIFRRDPDRCEWVGPA